MNEGQGYHIRLPLHSSVLTLSLSLSLYRSQRESPRPRSATAGSLSSGRIGLHLAVMLDTLQPGTLGASEGRHQA